MPTLADLLFSAIKKTTHQNNTANLTVSFYNFNWNLFIQLSKVLNVQNQVNSLKSQINNNSFEVDK